MNTRNLIGLTGVATALTLVLAGCSVDQEEGPGLQTTASQFVACLTAAGIEAKIGDLGPSDGRVIVKVPSQGSNGEISIDSDSDSGGEAPLALISDDSGNTWVAAASSAYFVADPDTQDAYAACEQEYPDFAQPEFDPQNDPQEQEYLAQQAEDALAFARCARDAGFAWVADPAVEDRNTPAIELPADLTEAEYRALLEACYEPELSLAWWIEDELGFDWQAVLEEFTGGTVGSSSISVGGDEE